MENINKTKNRWWWIRHAPVVNPGKKLYGQSDLDVDLSNDRKFESLATALPKNAVWITTPLRRARETAKCLAKLTEYKGTIEEYDQLKEQDFGDWEGKTWGDVPIKDSETFWNNPVENCIPNGESFKDVMSRVGHLVEQLNRRHNGRDIIAVAHMGTIRAAITQAIGGYGQGGLTFQLEPLSLTRIDANHENDFLWWKILGVNLFGSTDYPPPASTK